MGSPENMMCEIVGGNAFLPQTVNHTVVLVLGLLVSLIHKKKTNASSNNATKESEKSHLHNL